MKHSKMFKMLAGVAIVALVSTTFAQVTVPYTNSFESYSEGYDIGTNSTTTGWYADEGVALATTNYNSGDNYHAGNPVPSADHDVTMKFDGTVSNSISGTDNVDVYVDFLVQPTLWEEETAPSVPTNSQLAMYFDTNGYANVYHSYYETDESVNTTQKWTQMTSVDAISTGDWARVTYQMFYDENAFTYFNLWINGSKVTNEFAYSDPGDFLVTNGTYFINADCEGYGDASTYAINSFTVKNTGILDDFVVTDGNIAPFDPSTDQWTVDVSAGAGGSAVPSGETIVDEGDSFATTIEANTGYSIADITTNTVSVPITNDTVQVVTIDSVMNDIDIVASFELGEIVSSNGVDVASAWLQAYGLVLSQANADQYWEAFLADVNPTSGTFEIIETGLIDGSNYIKWVSQGETDGLGLPPFDVMGTDDLTNSWDSVGTVNRPSTLTTNVFMDATKTYYKLNATDQ